MALSEPEAAPVESEYRVVVFLVSADDYATPWEAWNDDDEQAVREWVQAAMGAAPDAGRCLSIDTDDGNWACIPARSIDHVRIERRQAIPPEQRHAESLGVAEE